VDVSTDNPLIIIATAKMLESIDQIRTSFKDGVLLPGNDDIVLTTHLDLTGPTAPSLAEPGTPEFFRRERTP
jgi:hypothetical protein